MEQFENEVELFEYFNVLWKRRWLIIVPTIFLALVSGIVSFLIPPKWEIDAIIHPGKYFVQSAAGTFTEVVGMDPKQLVGKINQGFYIRLTSAELNLDPRKFPKVKAENLRGTNLVRVSLRTGETDKAQTILNALFPQIKNELDGKINVENMGITRQIALKEIDINTKGLDIESLDIEIKKIQQEIIAAGNKLKISEERSRSLIEAMKGVKARIDENETQQKMTLAEKQGGVETQGLLLYFYSNEIQQNFRYYNTLEDNLSTEKNKREDLRLSVRWKEQVIKGFKTQIDKISQTIVVLRGDIELLNEKKQRIDYTQLVKVPTVSLYPVSPRKKMNVLIAGFLGLFCFSILALFLDYVEKRNIRLKTGS